MAKITSLWRKLCGAENETHVPDDPIVQCLLGPGVGPSSAHQHSHRHIQCDGLVGIPEIKFFRAGKRTKAEELLFTSSPKSGFSAYTSSLITMSQSK